MRNNLGKVLLVGAGPMAIDYFKVFNEIGVEFDVIGRSEKSAVQFEEKTGVKVITGGLSLFLDQVKSFDYAAVIVATGVEALYENTKVLLEFGVKRILVEKPGAINLEQLNSLNMIATEKEADLFIAYNRRFYASTLRAKEIIEKDGGVLSFNFEFTEWAHKIGPLIKGTGVKENWFLSNSSHVADLAFFLGGKPTAFNCYTSGGLEWHPAASIFAGAGITDKGALFSYHANWTSPGRWVVEVMTQNFRLVFKPMEELSIINKGQINSELINLGNEYEMHTKPGLLKQVESFLKEEEDNLCSIDEQVKLTHFYSTLANYN